ncbi:hypothetical protein HYPSUDRAFT_40271 [Hypholoma sublateritium FD-334 SS-4]|uniref:Heterokaryon incompatibility domain-containing protein n=1 Tax=Hypholoma sublateritium (strain FD-334 SS-4) TaxID=945553 RepID=A0A0D2NWH9_HYPSF|nr:hypothetical protein HYPSUDRAFT_40271 [Hypholoma sublateritium FD-334 SS-4]
MNLTEEASELPIPIHTVSLLPPSTPSEDIQMAIIAALRPHISNKMPMRLLAFNYAGSLVQLIGRDEMFRLILQRAYAEAVRSRFQAEWAEAGQVASATKTVAAWMSERRRKATLVSELVEHHTRYAILSHAWIRDTPGDVVYTDWAARARNPRGWRKIAKFCEVAARRHGVALAWMDTVCIDKSSSSELDEAIRSMYKWYRGAYVCIAYLAETRALRDMDRDAWFTRGWTLQELLAPHDIRFYNMDWEDLLVRRGTDPPPEPAAVVSMIEEKIGWATTITSDELALCRRGEVEKIPISRRLQLAARREVTREEDAAYSVMGLLGVDISVAYGEGAARASFRLLRELLSSKKHVLDIFNHDYRRPSGNTLVPFAIQDYLYRSTAFDFSGVDAGSSLDHWQPLEPIVLTHLGVRVPLLLFPSLRASSDADLNQPYSPKGDFSGSVTLYQYQKSYNLLDKRLYADNEPLSPATSIHEGDYAPLIVTFGLLNFSVEKGDIVLPYQGFSVPLDCGPISPGDVHPSDSIKILKAVTAAVLQLRSTNKKNRVSVGELKKHGIQLTTLYL